jgi:energy-coupling factor transport system permease protein
VFEQLYLERGSIPHNLDLWTKLLCLLILLPVATFMGPPWTLIPISLYLLLLIGLSKLPVRIFWRQVRLYYVVLTVAIMILSLVFSVGNLPSRAIIGLVLSARFGALIGSGVLFAMITDPIEFPIGLLRAKVPHKYGVTIMVAYRMMPLLANRVTGVVQVQKARGARYSLSLSSLPRLASELMSLMVPVVYSTLEASVGLSDTLLARGYDPNAPTITIPPTHLKKWDVGFALLSALLLVVAVWPYG